jgi:hypothetical protein
VKSVKKGKREYLKDRIIDLATHSKNKTVRELYRGRVSNIELTS